MLIRLSTKVFSILISVHIRALVLSFPFCLYAAPDVPASVVEQINPGRAAEELTTREDIEPESKELQIIGVPTPSSGIKFKKNSGQKFVLKGILFKGNTVFTTEKLKCLYANKIDTKVTTVDIQSIARQVTIFYRNAGYILSVVLIPNQEIDESGIVTLQVVEGFINEVFIEGNIPKTNRHLLCQYAKHIKNSKPLNMKILERYALLANDIPGANIKAVLMASKDTPGAADLIFSTEYKSGGLYIGSNNFNTELLGRNQINAGIYFNGISKGSQTGVRIISSFDAKKLRYASFNHVQQVNSCGLSFDTSFSITKTDPDLKKIDIFDLNTPGTAFLGLANLYYPLIRSRQKSLYLGLGFNYMDSHTEFMNQKLFDDKTRVANLNFRYDFIDRFVSSNAWNFSYSKGFAGLGAKASPPSRPGATPSFNKLSGEITRYQMVMPRRIFFLAGIKSQYSFDQLLSSEKFGFGGPPYGYGYDPSVITGDHGIAARFELEFHHDLEKVRLPLMRYFTFYNFGIVWNINKAIQERRLDAQSAGIGFRVSLFKCLPMELVIAKPFERFVTNDNKNDWRVMYNIQYNG